MARLTLTESELSTEPGTNVTLRYTLANESETEDRFEVRVEGIDPEWVAIPVPVVKLRPGESLTESIHIKPPRSTESRAGRYPFTVVARSLETGETLERAAFLDVLPFELLSMEVEPKRQSSGYFTKQSTFGVTIANLGNTEVNVQLFADDPEDACTYQYAQEWVMLAPGQQRTIALQVQPRSSPLIGTPKLYGFSVSARGVDNPRLSASTQGQLEHRALLTPAALAASLLFILLAFVWYMLRPMPPEINSFAPSASTVQEGESVTLTWSTTRADSVVITDGDRIWAQLSPNGSIKVTVPRTLTFSAKAVNGVGQSREVKVTVTAVPPTQIPEPVIKTFSISPKSANVGDTLTVRYEVENAARILLQPIGLELPINLTQFEFQADKPGAIEYRLIAYSADGKATDARFKVQVDQPSQARIIEFRALQSGLPIPEEGVEPYSRVTLEWQVENAARVDIAPGLGRVNATGSVEVFPERTTTYTLTAKDANGKPVTAQITIVVKEPPTAGGARSDSGGGGSAGSGGGGG